MIFRKFAELSCLRQVCFWLDRQPVQLPIAHGPEEVRAIVWQPARYHAVLSVLKNPVYAEAHVYRRSRTMVRLDAGPGQPVGHQRVLRECARKNAAIRAGASAVSEEFLIVFDAGMTVAPASIRSVLQALSGGYDGPFTAFIERDRRAGHSKMRAFSAGMYFAYLYAGRTLRGLLHAIRRKVLATT